MVKKIQIEEFLSTGKHSYVVLDARSPSEFGQGHIPGACNLPLFNDEERARVGIAYKQLGPQKAMETGLEIAGARLSELVSEAQQVVGDRQVVVHCWRGGKRSSSVSWLLDFTGMDVSVLEGGYKAYRTYQREWFEGTAINLLVLGGKTGSGKTEILKALAERGEQILDLEHLANHKGSAFGWIGEEEQPTTEQFENNVFECLLKFSSDRAVWVENESRTIGKVFIPESFWIKMRCAPLLHVEVPLAARVQKLVDVYATDQQKAALKESFMKIGKRLGGQNLKAAIEALEKEDFHSAAEIALSYYDKTYAYGIETSHAPSIERIETRNVDPDHLADILIVHSRQRNAHVLV